MVIDETIDRDPTADEIAEIIELFGENEMTASEAFALARKQIEAAEEVNDYLASSLRAKVSPILEGTGLLFTPHFHYPQFRASIHPTDNEDIERFVEFPDMGFYVTSKEATLPLLTEIHERLKNG